MAQSRMCEHCSVNNQRTLSQVGVFGVHALSLRGHYEGFQ